jgi:DNA/RNA-binding domain of Phe-tRNA-synthetase-like protein
MDLGEQEVAEKGEVIYRDDREVLTRRWVWRQSNKDQLLNETTHVFISIDVMEGLPDWLCENVVRDMEQKILTNGYGKIIHSDILAKDKLQTEFSY